jgi:serine/threonine protein kinase
MEFLNQTIGKYKLTRVIGEGGMACVYEGVHEKLGTHVALKVLNPLLARNAQLRQRFENEANFMASLNHPNIARVLDLEDQDGTLAIVMELLEGEDLDERVKRKGPLSIEEIKPLFDQVLGAFNYAHSKGIVHRDIKPANIFVDASNHVKILDFGIAKIFGTGNEMTQTGTQMGTPVYMSPEQVKGDKSIDHRSDIYSLGVTLYYLSSGKVPYESAEDSSFEIFTKIVNEPIPLLKNNHLFNSVIEKAVAKDRNERFQSIEEFGKAIITNIKFKESIDFQEKEVFMNVRNETSSVEAELLDNALIPKKKSTGYFTLLVVFGIILLGSGLFFYDRTKKRGLLYVLIAIYSWISYLNVFAKWIPEMVRFHNYSAIGALSIIVGWFIAYVVGTIDLIITHKKRLRTNK